MPHILKDLGWFTFLTNVAGASVIVTFSSILYQESCAHVMVKHKDSLENDDSISREPYKTVARLAVGKRFGLAVEVTIFIVFITNALAITLLGATTMNHVLPLNMTYYNRVRVWLVIMYFTTLPCMMYGRYTDLKSPAFVAVLASSITLACVFSISLAAKFQYGAKTSQFSLVSTAATTIASSQQNDGGTVEKFFKNSGLIIFVVPGPAVLLPNIIVLLRKPGKFQGPIIWSYILACMLYVTVATVPFLVFGERIRPSMIDTLNDAIRSLGMSSHWLAVVILAEIMLVIHFAMTSVLSLNPVFLSIEEKFKFPTSMFYSH